MDFAKTAREITRFMLPYLTTRRGRQLEKVLSHCPFDESQLAEDGCGFESESFLDLFMSAKRLEGCSDRTIFYYEATIKKMLESFDMPACDLGTEDIRSYLSDYQQKAGVSRVTVDNVRRIISSFYSWLEDEDHIIKSPVRRIKKVKAPQPIKETYSDEVVEILCDNCGSPRNLALIDLLRSTGMRVGELVSLDRSSIDTINRECVVHGKGNKDRIVYFDAKTKVHIENYPSTRMDSSEALFVSSKAPHERLQIGGVEALLRKLGRELDVGRVHPHKFRRTLATKAIDKGMPIEQVQVLLSHKNRYHIKVRNGRPVQRQSIPPQISNLNVVFSRQSLVLLSTNDRFDIEDGSTFILFVTSIRSSSLEIAAVSPRSTVRSVARHAPTACAAQPRVPSTGNASAKASAIVLEHIVAFFHRGQV